MEGGTTRNSLVRKVPTIPKPQWHPPWKLFRVRLQFVLHDSVGHSKSGHRMWLCLTGHQWSPGLGEIHRGGARKPVVRHRIR